MGILIIPVGIYIRRNLNETLVHETAHATTGGVIKALMRDHLGSLLLAIGHSQELPLRNTF